MLRKFLLGLNALCILLVVLYAGIRLIDSLELTSKSTQIEFVNRTRAPYSALMLVQSMDNRNWRIVTPQEVNEISAGKALQLTYRIENEAGAIEICKKILLIANQANDAGENVEKTFNCEKQILIE